MPGASFLPSHPWPHSPWNWAPCASWIDLSLYFETLPANGHGMHQNMIHNSMFVFKKGVQTVWHPVCSMLPTLGCSPVWWHNSSPKKNLIQYFTAKVLLYKLDVWCSLFDVSPQHWAWWFIMKLCLAAALWKCVLVYCTSLNCCLNGLSCCFMSFRHPIFWWLM